MLHDLLLRVSMLVIITACYYLHVIKGGLRRCCMLLRVD